jgi:hypothetical protein
MVGLLGNKEFEFVVSEMTLTVVIRRSASMHGVSVLVSVSGRIHLIPLFKNSLKKFKIASGNSCNYYINNVQTLGLRVYKKNSLTSSKYFLKDILLQCMYVILYFNPYEKKCFIPISNLFLLITLTSLK